MPTSDYQARIDRVFALVVREYVDTAEPVGSRTISKRSGLRLSPASIRSVMADLEDQGFLKQPHTSAGRVPTDKGYRYYVDSLMEPEELSDREKDKISREISQVRTVEGLADKVSKIIPKLTGNAAVMYIKNLRRISFLNHLLEELIEAEKIGDFLEEDAELFIDGIFRVLEQPEFQDFRKIRLLLQAFEEKVNLLEVLNKDLEEEGVQVHIGSENAHDCWENVSLVVKDCYAGDVAFGGVAVIGPTRMQYGKVISIVEFVADTVTRAVHRF